MSTQLQIEQNLENVFTSSYPSPPYTSFYYQPLTVCHLNNYEIL